MSVQEMQQQQSIPSDSSLIDRFTMLCIYYVVIHSYCRNHYCRNTLKRLPFISTQTPPRPYSNHPTPSLVSPIVITIIISNDYTSMHMIKFDRFVIALSIAQVSSQLYDLCRKLPHLPNVVLLGLNLNLIGL